MPILNIVNDALRGATVVEVVGIEDRDDEIILTALAIKTVGGHRLLLSKSGGGFKIFRAAAIDATVKAVSDLVTNGGDAR